jgi:hypothetical protein
MQQSLCSLYSFTMRLHTVQINLCSSALFLCRSMQNSSLHHLGQLEDKEDMWRLLMCREGKTVSAPLLIPPVACTTERYTQYANWRYARIQTRREARAVRLAPETRMTNQSESWVIIETRFMFVHVEKCINIPIMANKISK